MSTIKYQALKDFRSLFWLYECPVPFIILTFITSTQTSKVSLTRNFNRHFIVDL
jgi:hypothetical protein